MVDISIIVSVYNNERTILRAINSILNNSWGEYTYEIIIIDDGSFDGTVSALDTLPHNDNIIILKKRKNEGLLLSRIDGIKLASGKYVTFLDADDEYTNNLDMRIREAIHVDSDIIEFSFCYCYSDGRKEYPPKRLELEINICPVEQIRNIVERRIPVALWHRFYKNELLQSVVEKIERIRWFRKSMGGYLKDEQFLSPIVFFFATSYYISRQLNYNYTIFSETSVQKKKATRRQIRQDATRFRLYQSIMKPEEDLKMYFRKKYINAVKKYIRYVLRSVKQNLWS